MHSSSSTWVTKVLRTLISVAGVAAIVAVSRFWLIQERESDGAEKKSAKGPPSEGQVQVEVSSPRKGGVPMTTTQPGSVYAFEEADLYSQSYGYLSELNVDIGSVVKKGDILARIDVPELTQEVAAAQAAVAQKQANVVQATAKVAVAEADKKAAEAAIEKQNAALRRDEARENFHYKQLKRVQSLLELKSIDERLVDEKEDQHLASLSAVDAAKAAVTSAHLDVLSADARLGQAKADVGVAEAELQMAAAELAKADVRRKFGDIVSPYNGVITARNVHVGDFIRDAQHGGNVPLLRVERTDVMRVVVQIPDRLVPYTDVGDEAEIRIDALPGRVFGGEVKRFANSEDQLTKTMRTEVDLVNDQHLLRNGMYGRVTFILQQSTEGWTIPSSALVGRVDDGKGEIYVVKDGVAHRQSVHVGTDNGREVTILSGVDGESQVVVRYKGAIGDKVPVQVSRTAAPEKSPGDQN